MALKLYVGRGKPKPIAFFAEDINQARAMATAYYSQPVGVRATSSETLVEDYGADRDALQSAKAASRRGLPQRIVVLNEEPEDDGGF